MLKKFVLATLLALSTTLAHSAVRFNPYTNLWEGNVCANQYGWTYVQFQPIGSFCAFRMPAGTVVQGVILNQ